MSRVRCYECGKSYDYNEDGFCPKCGAFNQPPHRERIAADGSVIRVDGLNERNHENSFVHKELHAENRKRKGTELEQSEPSKAAKSAAARQAAVRQTAARQQLTQARRSKEPAQKMKKPGCTVAVIGFIILLQVLTALAEEIFG